MLLAIGLFFLGGMLGAFSVALLIAGCDELEVKRLRMENEALKKEAQYWKEQAMALRKINTKEQVKEKV